MLLIWRFGRVYGRLCRFMSTTSTSSSPRNCNLYKGPIKASSPVISSFDAVSEYLHPSLLNRIKELGFLAPTTIQSLALPPALQGYNTVITSETGSGKTLAFAIPLLNRMLDRKPDTSNKIAPRALVLSPNRELAIQTVQVLRDVGEPIGIHSSICTSRISLAATSKTDIIVATPGTLLTYELHSLIQDVSALVIDEVDQMLFGTMADATMKVLDIVRAVLSRNNHSLQYLLAGATIPDKGLKAPSVFIRCRFKNAVYVGSDTFHTTVPTVSQRFINVEEKNKLEHLEEELIALQATPGRNALIFANTSTHADLIFRHLRKNGVTNIGCVHKYVPAEERLRMLRAFIHGDDGTSKVVVGPLGLLPPTLDTPTVTGEPEQQDNEEASEANDVCSDDLNCDDDQNNELRASPNGGVQAKEKRKPLPFDYSVIAREGTPLRAIVTTDIVARGLDFGRVVTDVIQVDIATDAVSYLHRVGRTARAGDSGRAVAFVTEDRRDLSDAIRYAIKEGSFSRAFSRKRSFSHAIKSHKKYKETHPDALHPTLDPFYRTKKEYIGSKRQAGVTTTKYNSRRRKFENEQTSTQ